MKIFFLGTGPALSIPRPGHRDKTCLMARAPKSKTKRLRGSLLITHKNHRVLIDAGPDVLEQLKRVTPALIDAVLLTHGHADATGGIKKLSKFLKGRPLLCAEKQTIKLLGKKIAKNFEIQMIKPNHPFSLFGLKILPFRVEHTLNRKFPTLGYKIGKNFAYASDVSGLPFHSQKLLYGINTLVLDAAIWFGKKMPFHLNTAEAIKLAEKLKVKNLYLTQIGHGYPPHESASRQIRRYTRRQKIRQRVHLAYDNLRLVT